jgi:hypothetical protein
LRRIPYEGIGQEFLPLVGFLSPLPRRAEAGQDMGNLIRCGCRLGTESGRWGWPMAGA